MRVDRRIFLSGLAATFAAPRRASAATVTDATGRAIAAPDHVARVYPAGPPAAVTLYTLAPDLLMGWLEPIGPEAREFLLPEIAARPQLPRISGRGAANLDSIVALKPDLIVDIGTVEGDFTSLAASVEQKTGIPYALLDGHFDQIGATYRALGSLIGRSDDAHKLARAAETTTTTIAKRAAALNEKRPRVYYARDKSGLQTGFGKSMICESIEFVGARNVAADLHGSHGVVTIDEVRAWNPEIIVASDAEFAAKARSDPDWAGIAAVNSGRVHLAPKLPFGWVDFPPAVNRLIGLWWLGKIFYPDRFPEDIKAMTRDFYTTFYHVTPSQAQIERVLGSSV